MDWTQELKAAGLPVVSAYPTFICALPRILLIFGVIIGQRMEGLFGFPG